MPKDRTFSLALFLMNSASSRIYWMGESTMRSTSSAISAYRRFAVKQTTSRRAPDDVDARAHENNLRAQGIIRHFKKCYTTLV